MAAERFHAESIEQLLRRQRVANLGEIKAALGTGVDMTAFRKLRELEYLTSYSHRGKFYTLVEVADFDVRGLWTYQRIHFSRFGSLVDTVERFVLRCDRGYFAGELAAELQVEVKDPLLQLVQSGRLSRKPVGNVYLYTSPDPARQAEQIAARESDTDAFGPWHHVGDEVKAAIVLFLSTLNEKQRRLYGGLESLRLGRGGDRRVAELLGLDVHTIARGRHQLMRRDIDLERVRRPGGGRKPVEKKRPR
jgi:hypothetical protein